MRSNRNVVLGIALGTLVVAGSLWAESARTSLPIIRGSHKAPVGQKAAPSSASRAIIDNIDHYDSGDAERSYHSKITNPSIPWHEKCRLAIAHGRLSLLWSDIGGTLGGTVEHGRSTLRIRLLCPDQIAVVEVPADFEVHAAPHSEEVGPMSFDTDMAAIEASATDAGVFSSFHLVGGTSNGFKSPGHTTLIPTGNGDYAVDSAFNIGYHLEFTGAKGGPLEGASGSVDSSILMKAVGK
jgi:hypothetical protein